MPEIESGTWSEWAQVRRLAGCGFAGSVEPEHQTLLHWKLSIGPRLDRRRIDGCYKRTEERRQQMEGWVHEADSIPIECRCQAISNVRVDRYRTLSHVGQSFPRFHQDPYSGRDIIGHHGHLFATVNRTFEERPAETRIELFFAGSIEIKSWHPQSFGFFDDALDERRTNSLAAVLRGHENTGEPRGKLHPSGHIVLDKHRRTEQSAPLNSDDRSRNGLSSAFAPQPLQPCLKSIAGSQICPLVMMSLRQNGKKSLMICQVLDLHCGLKLRLAQMSK